MTCSPHSGGWVAPAGGWYEFGIGDWTSVPVNVMGTVMPDIVWASPSLLRPGEMILGTASVRNITDFTVTFSGGLSWDWTAQPKPDDELLLAQLFPG